MPEIEFTLATGKGRPAVVAPPHPQYGGRMDNPVVVTVAEALQACGYAPLRFNWRGVGKSAGSASGKLEDAEDDYRAALAKALAAGATLHARALAAGYSFGALAALRVCEADDAAGERRIERLILVAPPVGLGVGAVPDLATLEVPIQVIVGDSDQYAPLSRLEELLSRARDVRLDVIPDADHFFGFGPSLDKLAEAVRAGLPT
jgi:alpha/beta superfamily hydrolase